VLHEAQRAAAGQDDILALLRPRGGGTEHKERDKGEKESHASFKSTGITNPEKEKKKAQGFSPGGANNSLTSYYLASI